MSVFSRLAAWWKRWNDDPQAREKEARLELKWRAYEAYFAETRDPRGSPMVRRWSSYRCDGQYWFSLNIPEKHLEALKRQEAGEARPFTGYARLG